MPGTLPSSQLVERQLPRGREAGDADSDEPERTRAVAEPPVEEPARELGDPCAGSSIGVGSVVDRERIEKSV